MEPRRRTSVAGTWYPDDPARLAMDLDRYVAGADVDPLPHQPRAIVVPHAGLMYSGPVAAFAYKIARDRCFGSVILVGPSHFVPFRGVALWPEGMWDTPFGPVTVDRDLAAAIRAASAEVVDVAAAHGREHSLEMQLPFVAHLLPGVPIVPLVMGHQTRETAFALGDAIAEAAAARTLPHAGPRSAEVLLIASTDLSHYENASVASTLDARMMAHVERVDAEGLMAALEREPRHACGGGPTVAVLHAARQLGACHARVLRYADSGDVSGDKSAVVGYMAAAIW
jgi:AmmeMemoRadiSam system protein B